MEVKLISLVLSMVIYVSFGCENAEKLSELPFEELLKLRRSALTELMHLNSTDTPKAEKLLGPRKAQGFNVLDHMQLKESIDRGHYEEYEDDDDDDEEDWWPMMKMKSKGVGQVFDGAITALSFLAFGGYLLCLIVHSIRDKMNNNDVMPTTAGALSGILLQNQPIPIRRPAFTIRPGRKRRSPFDNLYAAFNDNDEFFNEFMNFNTFVYDNNKKQWP